MATGMGKQSGGMSASFESARPQASKSTGGQRTNVSSGASKSSKRVVSDEHKSARTGLGKSGPKG